MKAKLGNRKLIWITWENQRRNRELSQMLGATLFEWDEIDNIKNPIIKYAIGLFKTANLLFKIKPKIVFCQNPSLVLSLCVCIISKIKSFTIIIDAHNAGLFPLEGRSNLLMSISKFVQRQSYMTIVSNEILKKYVEENQGKAFVLPDPIPKFPKTKSLTLKHLFNVLFICSFSEDEPYESVFKAADLLPEYYHIYVTGNYHKKSINPASLPKNITLLGYIPEMEFIQMLHSVQITIDLTARENCLVCGAYESVAAEKPMIISDTKILRGFFNKGAIYTDNSASHIAACIINAKKNHSQLINEVRQLKIELAKRWNCQKQNLDKIISNLNK